MYRQVISLSCLYYYLATSAYLDNFENIEKSIGKALSDAGEQVLRLQLSQINKDSIIMHYLVW